jgi:uncharacterized membrane protein YvbJ
MRICPYCDSEIPENQQKCPSCGARYWESDDPARDLGYEEEEEAQGCLSIFTLHLLVAFVAFVLLLLIGFVINLLVHFEENQVKVIWIGVTLLVATALSGFIAKLRNKKETGNKDHK